jgi:flagellin
MRINHNVNAMTTQGALFRTGRELGKSLERLSTGLRINRASDDAAGLGVSENLRTQVRGCAQAQKNAQDGIAALNIAEGAMNEVSEVLQRMRELAVQAANDTLTSSERSYVQEEFAALGNEIDRISAVTNYNGMTLLAGDGDTRFGDGSVLWIDANSTDDNKIDVDINTIDKAQLGIGSSTVSAQSTAQTAIGNLDTAINSVNTERATIGALVNRLEHAVNNLLVSETNQQSAESAIRDVDFATETSNFTRNQILSQSATAMLSQANMMPSQVMSLLG